MGIKGPLVADHWEQHYPWAELLWSSLRRGELPVWTSLIHSGFPIAAESQIGIFYLPNLLFFGLLPLNFAYSHIVIFHFLLGGLGIIFYCRSMGLSWAASFVSACLFVFGTAYGGAYYNTNSLKTISWLPFQLLAFESFYKSNKRLCLLFLAFFTSQALLAGYLQVAIFAGLMFVFYVFGRLFLFRDKTSPSLKNSLSICLWLALAGAVAFLISLPQIGLTLQLGLLSNRATPEEGYAYVGSMSPLVLVTVLFPHAQDLFRGQCMYNGVFAFFLMVCAFTFHKRSQAQAFKLWVYMAVVSLLLALGQWSPLYIGLVELTGFQSFRTPAKFLVFFTIGSALLAAIGFDGLWSNLKESSEKVSLKRPVYIFVALLTGVWTSLGLFNFIASNKISWFSDVGGWYVNKFVYAKPGHPHDLSFYLNKFNALVESALMITSFDHLWTQRIFIFSAASILIVVLLVCVRRRTARVGILFLGLVLLFCDVYLYSGKGIRENYARYDQLPTYGKLVTALTTHNPSERAPRLFVFRQWHETVPMIRSVNMLYGVADIGAYSPLVLSRYYESIGLLGNVDDSNLASSADSTFILERLPLLNFLGITHILSTKQLHRESLLDITGEAGFKQAETWLYANRGARKGRPVFLTSYETHDNWSSLKDKLMAPGFNPESTLLIEKSQLDIIKDLPPGLNIAKPATDGTRITLKNGRDNGHTQWEIIAPGPGFFVLPETYYPGWQVRLNGSIVEPFKAYGLFLGIPIPRQGTYDLTFDYSAFEALKLVFKEFTGRERR